ncbi:LytR/AlgR family response regulator transcription factor [Parasphingorhabdus cellanae]|uniref:LytTR family transcriptional regulator n=1 Tax=Parasphingorhabdus cellanae TaxID=2806553 RepID=A0ABX7T1E3_9SPHN|nr:LytTR family DNA-binding domain-containing protein [Parasphingorhabdus cellanae]QTD55388.1 LytTR family transcriptional regulator [Parasphingorhabdus cellanae]
MSDGLDRIFIRPLTAAQALLVAFALTLVSSLYCVIYTTLAGRGEPLIDGIIWAALNIVPWLICFEAAKRLRSWSVRLGIVVIFAAGMSYLDSIFFDSDVVFELTRRLPGAAIIVGMLALSWVLKRFVSDRAMAKKLVSSNELPLLIDQIDWVMAAGNYVELHGSGKPILHRMSISAMESLLSAHDFVRIHRSVLVRRRNIQDLTGNIVTLNNGLTFKTGNRYRSALL